MRRPHTRSRQKPRRLGTLILVLIGVMSLLPGAADAARGAATSCDTSQYSVTCLEPSILEVQEGNTSGTGFVIQSDSTGTYLLTNKHVVANENGVTGDVYPADYLVYPPDGGRPYRVLAVALSPYGEGVAGDLAVLKLPPSDLRPLRFGNSDRLVLLQPVIAIGYPFALKGRPTVTRGYIAKLHYVAQSITFGPSLLLHSAILNPGNSGGPLLNTTYQVVGVNTITLYPDFQGFSGSIPANSAKPLVMQLIAELKR